MSAAAKRARTRITVLLGNRDSDRVAFEILNLLAADIPAEIQGLFLEDIELLTLAELPVAREYCRLTHVERRLHAADLERQLKIRARTAEQALAAIARRAGFTWSFRTMRGVLDRLLQDAVEEMDLMLLGAPQRTLPVPGERAIPYASRQPVAVLYEGTKASGRALDIARRMAATGGRPLTILLASDDPEKLRALHKRAAAAAGTASARFHELVSPAPGELVEKVRAARAGALVLGVSAALLKEETLELFRKRLNCPLVLVK